MNLATEFELNERYSYLIGKGIRYAQRVLNSMQIRIIRKDGIDIAVDSTYKENRINAEMRNKIIIKILSIG